jgi:hypothetical protein
MALRVPGYRHFLSRGGVLGVVGCGQLLIAVFGFAPSVAAGRDGSTAGADAGALEPLPPESPLDAGCETSPSAMIAHYAF